MIHITGVNRVVSVDSPEPLSKKVLKWRRPLVFCGVSLLYFFGDREVAWLVALAEILWTVVEVPTLRDSQSSILLFCLQSVLAITHSFNFFMVLVITKWAWSQYLVLSWTWARGRSFYSLLAGFGVVFFFLPFLAGYAEGGISGDYLLRVISLLGPYQPVFQLANCLDIDLLRHPIVYDTVFGSGAAFQVTKLSSFLAVFCSLGLLFFVLEKLIPRVERVSRDN